MALFVYANGRKKKKGGQGNGKKKGSLFCCCCCCYWKALPSAHVMEKKKNPRVIPTFLDALVVVPTILCRSF